VHSPPDRFVLVSDYLTADGHVAAALEHLRQALL
jgi:hypothetical protein